MLSLQIYAYAAAQHTYMRPVISTEWSVCLSH